MNNDIMGKRIKELRIEHGLTQQELAKIIGVQPPAIYKYESNLVSNLKRSTISKLSDVFKCSPLYIMGISNEREYKAPTPVILNDGEKNLIQKFNILNSDGQLKVNEYINDLLSSEKYNR